MFIITHSNYLCNLRNILCYHDLTRRSYYTNRFGLFPQNHGNVTQTHTRRSESDVLRFQRSKFPPVSADRDLQENASDVGHSTKKRH